MGIETLGGVFTQLIERNTTIPTRRTEVFSTASDSQKSVEIHVLQGERSMARDNRTLGKFELSGLPKAPRGVPQIEVSFDIDANGIVNVAAKDRATGRSQAITLTSSSGLSPEEIARMVDDAHLHAEDDKQRQQEIELRNRLEAMIYATEKALLDGRERLPVDDVGAAERALLAARQAAASGERLEAALKELTQASHRLAELLYRKAASDNASEPPAAEAAPKAEDGR